MTNEIIKIYDLPKISLNEWYAGKHWTERKKIKDIYKILIRSKCKIVFSENKKYNVSYEFNYKKNPLDATNTIAMTKMIEDVLFKSDKWDIVKSVKVSSLKSEIKQDYVIINVEIL